MSSRKIVPKRILIIKPSALGDVVTALPALSSLRASFPNAEITWLIRPEFAPLLSSVSGWNKTLIFDRILLGKWFYNPKAFSAMIRVLSELRKGKYDLVIDLQGLFRTALFTRLTGCKKRFGMTTAREFGHLFYTHSIDQDPDSIHVIDYYLKIVKAAGASTIKKDFNIIPSDQAARYITALLLKNNIPPEKYAILIPSAAHTFKCWPIEKFAQIAEKINAQFDLNIIAVGSKNESELIDKLTATAKVPVANFAGLTDISQLVAILKGAKLVISNDTGPGHIAAALNRKIVIIFGQTNPARICPYHRPETIAAIDPDKRGHQIENQDPKYRIENVTVKQVLQKINAQLT